MVSMSMSAHKNRENFLMGTIYRVFSDPLK